MVLILFRGKYELMHPKMMSTNITPLRHAIFLMAHSVINKSYFRVQTINFLYITVMSVFEVFEKREARKSIG